MVPPSLKFIPPPPQCSGINFPNAIPQLLLSPPTGSGTSKKLAKRNAAAKMLVRIHNVPLDPREGSEVEMEEDQFSIVSLGGE